MLFNQPSTWCELSRSVHFTGHRLQPMFFPCPTPHHERQVNLLSVSVAAFLAST